MDQALGDLRDNGTAINIAHKGRIKRSRLLASARRYVPPNLASGSSLPEFLPGRRSCALVRKGKPITTPAMLCVLTLASDLPLFPLNPLHGDEIQISPPKPEQKALIASPR